MRTPKPLSVVELKNKIEKLSPWQYELSFRDGIIMTPVRDTAWKNRHMQRSSYFWEPLLQGEGSIFSGARVLDLGCNAGYWTLKALQAGAREVVAVDAHPLHLDQLRLVLEENGISSDQCTPIEANVYDLDYQGLGQFDIVLCLGLVYHLDKSFELFKKISSLQPNLLLLDTKVSRMTAAVMEVQPDNLDAPQMATDCGLAMAPSVAAIKEMMKALGFRVEPQEPHFTDWTGASDYRDGDRLAFWCWREQEGHSVCHGEQSMVSFTLATQKQPAIQPTYFTICASNYLAQALSFAESLSAIYPEGELHVFLLDDACDLPEVTGVRWRNGREALTTDLWLELWLRYNILEFATALKPACFQRLFDEGHSMVAYCDPDMIFYSRPIEMEQLLLDGAGGVILPHMLTPLPRDGKQADDLAILKSGVFNLGFLALAAGKESLRLLDWWMGWLRTECWSDPKTGVFTDQKWMNFVPCLWPEVKILYHPGYDVAYWNLHERRLDIVNDQWRINDDQLVFFHFSGFNPSRSTRLSKHENRFAQITKGSPLDALLGDYSERLFRHGYMEYSKRPLPLVRFENGTVFDVVARHAFSMAQDRGVNFANPLATEPDSFYRWMLSSELGSIHPRYFHAILALRGDVASAYPDFEGSQAEALRNWVRTSGIKEMKISPALLLELGINSRTGADSDERIAVNYIGYLRSEMGVGEAARGYVRALQANDIDVSLMDISQLAVHRCADESLVSEETQELPTAPANINLIHVNADMLPSIPEYFGQNLRRRRYNIGLWAWESEHFPDGWKDRFSLVDEIWVGSQFMAAAITPWADCPVLVMPYVVELPVISSDRTQWGIPESSFVFLFLFDFLSVVERKNPVGVIRAFKQAFRSDDDVVLVIKTISGDRCPEQLEELRKTVGDSRVLIIDETLDRNRLLHLVAACDAFVSLHRLEGFGLGMAEAMALGKAVIATAYGGNTDFMRPGNSILVPYELKMLDQDYGPYVKGSRWAEPDIDFAAAEMRRLYQDPTYASMLGVQAKKTIQEEFSRQAVGKRMSQRLAWLEEKVHVKSQECMPTEPTLSAAESSSRDKVYMGVTKALLRDMIRYPRFYAQRRFDAFQYWRVHGTNKFLRRVIEELRRRGAD